ncbi:hypothetical protein ACF0H5_011199 [Mactra antiquata]
MNRGRRFREALSRRVSEFLPASVNFNIQTGSVIFPYRLQQGAGKVYISEPFNATKLPNLIDLDICSQRDSRARSRSLPDIAEYDEEDINEENFLIHSELLNSIDFSGSYENIRRSRSRSLPQLVKYKCNCKFFVFF